jgi:hypothetical protein
MRYFGLSMILVVVAWSSALYAQNKRNTPTGWGATGSNPGGYDYIVDTTERHGGKSSALIRPKATAEKDKFGSLVQAIRPDKYRGKRIRFSGYVKTEDVGENVQLWVRVDGPGMRALDFSNMDKRSIKGTTDWKKYDLVIDVPAEAEAIVFGAFLGGTTGRAWIDDLQLESVGNDTPKTSNVISEADRKEEEEELKKVPKEEIDKIIASYRALPTRPVNLDFEAAGSDAAAKK